MAVPGGSSRVAALMREGGQQRAANAGQTGDTLGSMLQQAAPAVAGAFAQRGAVRPRMKALQYSTPGGMARNPF